MVYVRECFVYELFQEFYVCQCLFYIFEYSCIRRIYVDEYKFLLLSFFIIWYLSLQPLFQSLFCLKYLLYALTFNLRVSFALKWVSYRQHIAGSCFFVFLLILSATLCLLTGAFSPLTFKVITDRYAYCHFKPYFPVDFTFLLCPFLFLSQFDFLLWYIYVLFVFVNLFYASDL